MSPKEKEIRDKDLMDKTDGEKEIRDKAKEKDKIAKARTKIDSANSAIGRTKNTSTIKSK